METIEPSISAEAFEVLARRAGLSLSAAQSATLYGVYGHFEAMLARVRTPLGVVRGREAEPAHVFVPGQEWMV